MVINASLLGIIDGCRKSGRFRNLYAARHGIEGVLREEFLDLTSQNAEEIGLLRTTPAAGTIGTCRYKIRPDQREDLERIVEVFRAHDIDTFFYIGGNDSMDTAHRVSDLASKQGLELVCVGVPKTIDNDLGDQERRLIDHTPGYGSAARYWALMVQNLNEENRGSRPSDPVLVVQAMGRRIGFIPAAARLGDPDRKMPLQIYLPEARISLPELAENVNLELQHSGRAIVVIGEGFDVGALGGRTDAFGHTQYGASQTSVMQTVVNYLNQHGLTARGSARGQIPGTDQRNAIIAASTVDLKEAQRVGEEAVRIALENGTGYMVTIVRKTGLDYAVTYSKAPLAEMADSERTFPKEWIAKNRIDVTDDFVNYARPLMGEEWVSVPLQGGLQRFARLKPIFAPTKCAQYIPQAYREGTDR
jgi:6-phosphofructokinase 1